MEACMKRRYAIMAAALLHAEDDEPLPDKRKTLLEWEDATQRVWDQKPVE